MTHIDLVQEEAARLGLTVTDERANTILWSFTGFPSFWAIKDGETNEECCRRQVREALTGLAEKRPWCLACGWGTIGVRCCKYQE